MKIEVMAKVVEGRYCDEFVVDILGRRIVIAHIPKGVKVTPELSKAISEEWTKPEYSLDHPVFQATVMRLVINLNYAAAHLDSQPK